MIGERIHNDAIIIKNNGFDHILIRVSSSRKNIMVSRLR